MSFNDYTSILSEQYTGQEIVAEAYEILPNTKEAISQYEVAKNRLLTCNSWHQVAGTFSASFQIVDAAGREVNRKVQWNYTRGRRRSAAESIIICIPIKSKLSNTINNDILKRRTK